MLGRVLDELTQRLVPRLVAAAFGTTPRRRAALPDRRRRSRRAEVANLLALTVTTHTFTRTCAVLANLLSVKWGTFAGVHLPTDRPAKRRRPRGADSSHQGADTAW